MMTESRSDSPPPTAGSAGCCGGATDWVPTAEAEQLAHQLAAIADPVRLQVLSIIANAPLGEVCACDFVGPIERSQPTISHHLKVLTEAGLIDGDKRGRWVWYRLAPERLSGLLGAVSTATTGATTPATTRANTPAKTPAAGVGAAR
jgi:ArsR family transcriptional regulator